MDDDINEMARARVQQRQRADGIARDKANARAAADRQAAQDTQEIRKLLRKFARWAGDNNIPTDYKQGMFGKRGWVLMRGNVLTGSKVEWSSSPPFVVYTDGSTEYTHHGGPKYRETATEMFLRDKTMYDVRYAISGVVEKTGIRWTE